MFFCRLITKASVFANVSINLVPKTKISDFLYMILPKQYNLNI